MLESLIPLSPSMRVRPNTSADRSETEHTKAVVGFSTVF